MQELRSQWMESTSAASRSWTHQPAGPSASAHCPWPRAPLGLTMSHSNRPDDVEHLEELYHLPSQQGARPHPSWAARRATIAATILVAVIAWLVWSGMHHDDITDTMAGLPDNGLVAADNGTAHTGGDWLVTSGTLRMSNGMLWSGVPDGEVPDPDSGRTGSAVLRAVTTRRDYMDATVHLEMRLAGLTSTERTPQHDWDGVHMFLRYGSPDELYVADLARRDGQLTIKRKQTPDSAT